VMSELKFYIFYNIENPIAMSLRPGQNGMLTTYYNDDDAQLINTIYEIVNINGTEIRHGKAIKYDRNGREIMHMMYKNDRIHGNVINYAYSAAGGKKIEISIGNYFRSWRHGRQVRKYHTGKIASEREFVLGAPVGIHNFYCVNGILYSTCDYRSGNGIVTDCNPSAHDRCAAMSSNPADYKHVIYDDDELYYMPIVSYQRSVSRSNNNRRYSV
jgi:hypothetical protein